VILIKSLNCYFPRNEHSLIFSALFYKRVSYEHNYL